jgi:hypothetical protein
MPSTRLLRISAANIGPNLCHQNRTVSWQTSMPRSCSKSSTLRSESGKRMYVLTAQANDLGADAEVAERLSLVYGRMQKQAPATPRPNFL